MQKINRRAFLGSTVAGTLATAPWAAQVTGANGSPRPIKLGLIGCGGYGLTDVRAALEVGGVEVVAVCDVDSDHLRNAVSKIEERQGSRPRAFKSYEDLIAMDGLEAVIIATPPHWHALQFIAALQRGLDVYCEKPLAYDIREGRAMVDAARRSNRVVQIGFQRRQSPAIRAAREYVQTGKAGRIVQVEAQIFYQAGQRDAAPQTPPPSLDWNLWCGPAPKLPYSPQIGHVSWRLEKEYGHGHLVDWGIHLIDATRWTLGETTPYRVQSCGGLYYHKEVITTPDVLTTQFDFHTCPVIWRHHIWGAAEYTPETKNGIFFMGDKATVFVTDDRWVVIPRDSKQERQVHEASANMGVRQMEDFLTSVRTREPASCQPQDAYLSTATVQLGMIAYETGTRIEWDNNAEAILNNPQASQLLKRAYRWPWVHPYSG